MTIELIRDNKSLDGQHGTMELGGKLWHTLEPPDLGNLPYKSCVPQGEYILIPFESSKYGACFIMVNPDLNVYRRKRTKDRPDNGRFKCLFVHRGNEVHNFVGCVGSSHAYDVENDRLLSSTTQACITVNSLVHDEASYMLRITHEFE